MLTEEMLFSPPLSMMLCFTTILWPLLITPKSILHRIGIFVHFSILILIFSMMIYSFYKKEYDYEFSLIIINNFKLSLKMNKIGSIFCSLVLLLWPASYAYSIGYLKATREGNDSRYLLFLNLSFLFSVMLGLADNLLTLFIAYELLTLSTIPLIGHHYSTHVNKSLKKYITYLFASSLCLFFPFIVIMNNLGLDNFNENITSATIPYGSLHSTLLLIVAIYGFAKAAIFPVHSWLPSAMAANYPTSSILHGVLVVNTGIYCIIKVIFEIFGQGNIAVITANHPFILMIPFIGVCYSGIVAIFQSTVKKILAWSTVSQLNLIALFAISGANYAKEIALSALLLHSLSKLCLFFSSGIIYTATRATRLDDFRYSGQKFPLTFLIFIFSSMFLVGLPFGFVGKFKDMLLPIFARLEMKLVAIAIIASTTTSLIYLGKIIIAMSRRDGKMEDTHGRSNLYMSLSTLYVFTISILYNFYALDIFNFIIRFFK